MRAPEELDGDRLNFVQGCCFLDLIRSADRLAEQLETGVNK